MGFFFLASFMKHLVYCARLIMMKYSQLTLFALKSTFSGIKIVTSLPCHTQMCLSCVAYIEFCSVTCLGLFLLRGGFVLVLCSRHSRSFSAVRDAHTALWGGQGAPHCPSGILPPHFLSESIHGWLTLSPFLVEI